MNVTLTVNGEERGDDVEPRLLLAHYLREVRGLRATNIGCDTTSCGACTVLVDGLTVKSCTVLAATAHGHVTSAEPVACRGVSPAPSAAAPVRVHWGYSVPLTACLAPDHRPDTFSSPARCVA